MKAAVEEGQEAEAALGSAPLIHLLAEDFLLPGVPIEPGQSSVEGAVVP